MSKTTPATDALALMRSMGHEQVMHCHDEATGLRAIIAIHNTVLGPALGGTRFWAYGSEQEALVDVLRLSRGMSFKASVAGLNLGGGKAVIIGDPSKIKNETLLRRFGMFVNNLGGKYITAEDVGVNERDMQFIRMETEHVTGLPTSYGGSGDPSPVTAYGVYLGMKASLKHATGSDGLQGKRVVVHGVGKVGGYLVSHLVKEGAEVFIFDINGNAMKRVATEYGATPIKEKEIVGFEADIYAPCALGGGLNPDTIPKLNYSIIAGGANNQLLDEVRDGKALKARGILYAPDFMINAGGLINVYAELEGYDRQRAMAKAEQIYATTTLVLKAAKQQNITTHQAALDLALQRIDQMGQIQKFI